MKGKFSINKKYIVRFFLLLFIEFIIAVFIHDHFIRPFVGDILVIPLLYCFIKIWINPNIKIPLLPSYIFLFAVIIEILQYFNFAEKLSLGNYSILRIILGSVFDWKDILCYFLGMVFLFLNNFISAAYKIKKYADWKGE